MGRAEIDAAIDRLRKVVAEGPHKGFLLEDAKRKDAVAKRNLGRAGDRIGRWHRRARSGSAGAPLPAYVPADYVYFAATYGSLTWMAPAADPPAGWIYLHNTGDKALLDLAAPNATYDVGEAADALGIDTPPLFVFHDGFNDGFAFDERVRDAAGEALVVAFAEDNLGAIAAQAAPPKTFGTFAEWLTTTVARYVAALEGRSAPAKDDALVPIPASIAVPEGDEINADEGALDDILTPGWRHLATGKLDAVMKGVTRMLKTEPLYLYAYGQGLDALAKLVAAGDATRRPEQWRLAWTLLALSRRGIVSLHDDYNELYRQKAATVLAGLALEAPELVSREDARRLAAEALGVPQGKDDQMDMTGYWDTKAIAKALAR